MQPMFDMIMEYVAPAKDLSDQPLRMQIVNLAYDDYLGRMGIGRVYEGTINSGQQVSIYSDDGRVRKAKI